VKIALLVDGEAGVTMDRWLALVRTAEDCGLDAVLLSDHLRDRRPEPRPGLEPFTACAAAAAGTRRLRLGTLTSPIGRRHPAELAKIAGSLDQLAPGRLDLGVGLGSDPAEFAAFGLPRPAGPPGYRQLDEYLQVLALLLRPPGEAGVSFAGQYYRLDSARLDPRPPRSPRVVLGKRGRARSVAIAARWADEYNTVAVDPAAAAVIRARLDAALRAAERRRPLALSVMTDVLIGADRAELAERARRHEALHGWISADRLLARPPEQFLVGTPDRLAPRIAGYAAAGVDRMILKCADVADLEAVRQLGALAEAVRGQSTPQRGPARPA
jgi:alkanesulfonate monooxygenase SsuD/methylene tetrahydromethanopterin reductase-like flavin-dependent oxidoreductase (luciferase family)